MACTWVTLLLMVTEHEQLLCSTQQRSRSIFLMQHLYYVKCYHMRHNTEQGNPVHNSTVPRYSTVNTSHNNILAINWCVLLLGPVNRIQKHDSCVQHNRGIKVLKLNFPLYMKSFCIY